MTTPTTFANAARPAGIAHREAGAAAAAASSRAVLAGRILSGLALAFLLVDSVMKVARLAPAVEGTVSLGYPASAILGIGLLQLACVLLYAVPRTAVLGALLLTAYLGGAVATHVRIASPLVTHVLFPVYVAALLWGGLYLREPRLRALLPFRR
ncbi:DoxX family protein [Roseisolibacter agri]|uniref:DoxX family protein n=1 Tax=Roseisolibacter agri TaxID=2014610 RepID=UPI0024E0E378|nr:DoxX family protein [Roseisolibacter agri]